MAKRLRRMAWRAVEAVLPWLAVGYIRLVHRTVRWQWVGRERLDAVLEDGEPVVAAFWHGRLLMMAPVVAESARPVHIVISANRDGEAIARVMRSFGGRAIRGSSANRKRRTDRKGGRAALRAAMAALDAGYPVGITPDGPRGPRMRAQGGAAAMSAQAGVPVLPLAWATRRGRLLGSWDRFLLPWPFDRGVYVVGAPLHPSGTDRDAVEAHRLAIEGALLEVTRRADAHMGRAPVMPA